MRKLEKSLIITLIFTTIFAVFSWCVPILNILNASDVYLTKGSIYNDTQDYGAFVNSKYNKNTQTVDYMLFNTFKLKSVNAITLEDEYVYLGGDPFGFVCDSDGVIVVGKNIIQTGKDTVLDNIADNQIKIGDVITSVNGVAIKSGAEISSIINSKENIGKVVDIVAIRKNKEITTQIKPAYDLYAKKYKLGVWVKEQLSGIGTVTYIKPNSLRFGALGHPLVEPSSENIIQVREGDVYDCNILGVKRAVRGEPGEYRGVIANNTIWGAVDKNTDSGIFGNFTNSNVLNNRELIPIGTRNDVKPGKAQIYSCLDGKNIRAYDIEIIKTNYNNPSNKKSLVFKVTDKRLRDTTGGIVQGMSGSPIVQNGKLIGAVTHVFINDATKAFGIYIENMLQN